MSIKIRKVIFLFIAAAVLFVVLAGGLSFAAKTGARDKVMEFEFFRNYSWDVGRYPFDESNKIGKWVIEHKKVKVNFSWPGGNERERFNIMVASDNLPDVVMIPRDDTWTRLINLNKLYALDDWYKKYPGYRTNCPREVVDFTRQNGKIFAILNWPKNKTWMGFGTGLILNMELHQQLGSPKLDTLEDLYQYLKKVKNSGILVDGKTIVPLQPSTAEVNFGLLWCAFGDGRLPADVYGITCRPDKNNRITHVINDSRFPEFIKYLRKLYKEGLISREYAIEKQEQIDEKMTSKRVAVYTGFNGIDTVDRARTLLELVEDTNPYEAIDIPAASGVDKSKVVADGSQAVGWNVICITKKAKQPERIYEYLDWVFSNEGQRIMMYGPPGELWDKVNEKGFPIIKPGKSLALSDDEKREIPIGEYMYPGNTSWVDDSKLFINSQIPPEKREWRVNQQMKFVNRLRDTTEFTGINTITDKEVLSVYTDHDVYWKTKLVELVTGDEDVNVMLGRFKKEVYNVKRYKLFEDYANKIWHENRKKMKLEK